MTIQEEHPASAKTTIPWWRWLITVIAGIMLWFLAGLVAGLIAAIVAGEEGVVIGRAAPMLVLSIVQATIIVFGIRYVWRIVYGGWRSIGFVTESWKQDSIYGAVAGLAFALVQYFVLLPLTGGAERSDVVASAEIAGTSLTSLFAAIILGWLAGALSEEIFYRGHLIRSLQNLLGGKAWAAAVASIISIGLFAYGHAYQGSIGMLNAGLVGAFYTALFLWRGRLTTGIVAHGVYNTLALLAIYFILA